jgi:hypothetical protein
MLVCCKKIRSDVELRSTDDRVCQSCFKNKKNESDLELIRRQTAADAGNVKLTPAALGKERGVKQVSVSKEAITVRSRQREVRTVKNSPSKTTNSSQIQFELGGNDDDMQSTAKAEDCHSGIAEHGQKGRYLLKVLLAKIKLLTVRICVGESRSWPAW